MKRTIRLIFILSVLPIIAMEPTGQPAPVKTISKALFNRSLKQLAGDKILSDDVMKLHRECAAKTHDYYTSIPEETVDALKASGKAWIYSLITKKILRGTNKDWVRQVIYSPDGELLASVSFDNVCTVWKDGGDEQSIIESKADLCAFNPDGTHLAIAGQGTIDIWDLGNKQRIKRLIFPNNHINTLMYDRSGARLSSGHEDAMLISWDLDTEKPIKSTRTENPIFFKLLLNPRSTQVLCNAFYRVLLVSDIMTEKPIISPLAYTQHQADRNTNLLNDIPAEITCVAWTTDGDSIIVGDSMGEINIWNVQTQSYERSFKIDNERISPLAIHPAGRYFFAAHSSGQIGLHDLEDGTLIKTINPEVGMIYSLALHPSGNRLVVTGCTNDIMLYELEWNKAHSMDQLLSTSVIAEKE